MRTRRLHGLRVCLCPGLRLALSSLCAPRCVEREDFSMQVRQLSAWPARLPSVESLEKSQRDANALRPSQAISPSAAAIARRGGAPAARIERATRSVPAWFGTKAGSPVYLHLADRAGSMSHTSAPLSGLGPGTGGRSTRVRPGTPVVLRSGVLPCHFPRQRRSKRRGNAE